MNYRIYFVLAAINHLLFVAAYFNVVAVWPAFLVQLGIAAVQLLMVAQFVWHEFGLPKLVVSFRWQRRSRSADVRRRVSAVEFN